MKKEHVTTELQTENWGSGKYTARQRRLTRSEIIKAVTGICESPWKSGWNRSKWNSNYIWKAPLLKSPFFSSHWSASSSIKKLANWRQARLGVCFHPFWAATFHLLRFLWWILISCSEMEAGEHVRDHMAKYSIGPLWGRDSSALLWGTQLAIVLSTDRKSSWKRQRTRKKLGYDCRICSLLYLTTVSTPPNQKGPEGQRSDLLMAAGDTQEESGGNIEV